MRLVAAILTVAIVSEASVARADVVADCAAAAEVGQTERDKGHLTRSRDVFVTCARRECPQTIRTDCSGWLEDVNRRLPSASFAIQDSRGDVSNVTVEVDGNIVAEAASGRAFVFDPGSHSVVVRSARHPTTRTTFVLREGERSRVVSMMLDTPATGSSGSRVPATGALETSPRFSIAWPIVTGALAVGGGIAFTGLYLSALGRRDDLAQRCGNQCAQDDVDPIVTKNTVAVVALGVGIAAAVATVVLLAVRHPSPPASSGLTTRGIVFD